MNKTLNKRTSIVFTLSVILIPLLRVYSSGVPGIDLAELFLLLASFFSLLFHRKIVVTKPSRKIISLLLFFLVITLFDIFLYPHSVINIIVLFLRWSFYLFVLVIGGHLFNTDLAKKLIIIVSLIVCFGLITQIVGYYFFSKTIVLRIPFLKINDSMNDTGTSVTYTYNASTFRASSFFSEPAHFSYFICIALMVSLVLDKPKYLISLFFTFCIVLSTSAGGIILSAIVWLYYLFFKEKQNRFKKALFIVMAGTVLFVVSLETPLFDYFVSKIVLLFESHGNSSLRTNYIEQLSGFNFGNLITGVGFGNAEYYITNVLNKPYTYVSSISLVLMWTGFFGLLLLLYVLIYLIAKSSVETKIFVIVFLVSLFGTGMITSSYLILFLIWPLNSYLIKNMQKKKVILQYSKKIGAYKYV